MKKAILLLPLFLYLHTLQAQQDIPLPGLVVEQNSQYRTGKVKYLSNAEIKSAGATPQRSDDKGQFTLVFADRPGGDVARIFAAKSGYEVVNEEEMKQASVIGRLKPLKIVMCEQGKLYDNQIAYYNIARDASLDAYKRKVAALQQDGKEQQRLIAELRVQFNQDIKTKDEAIALLDKQRQNTEKQAKELADKFVTENLDDQSPAYQRAFAAFEAKNIELAKAILDSVDLEKRLALNSSAKAKEQALVDTLQKNIAKRAEEIRKDVNMCLFKARLHKLDYEWAFAERYYDLAIAYDSSNYEVVFEVAHYMQSQNQFAKARTYYEKALALTSRPFEKSTILNNLGVLLSDNNEMGGAKKAYEEALQIYRKLAEKNPQVYNLDAAMTDINIGLFYEKLLKSTGDMSLKAAGLELMRDAEQRLAIFPEVHPQVQQYRPYIKRLTQFFKDFDQASFQLQQQIERLSALEKANETEKDPHKKVQRQQEIISILSEIEKAMPDNAEVANLMAARYGSLAWYQLFVRQFPEAEQSARAGLAKAPSEEWINTNLALALLYQGKWEAAKEIYEALKDKPYNDSTYRATFLEDLDALEKEGITHPDVAKARKLLEKG